MQYHIAVTFIKITLLSSQSQEFCIYGFKITDYELSQQTFNNELNKRYSAYMRI